MMNKKPGFTLIELLVALSLSALVLIGIIGVAAQMVRWHMEGSQKATDTGWTLVALQRMTQELQAASVLYCPSYVSATHPANPGCPGTTSDFLDGCKDTTKMNVPAGWLTATPKAFHYCVAKYGNPQIMSLLRYESSNGDCPMSVPQCGLDNPSAPEVLARYVEKIDGTAPYFTRRDDAAGVQVRFRVGIANTTDAKLQDVNKKMNKPVYTDVDTIVNLNKPYGNSLD